LPGFRSQASPAAAFAIMAYARQRLAPLPTA